GAGRRGAARPRGGAAAAGAGREGRPAAPGADLRAVAPLVLPHRARRGPYDPPTVPPERLADAVDATLGRRDPGPADDAGDPDDGSGGSGGDDSPLPMGPPLRPPMPPPATAASTHGRFVRAVPVGGRTDVAVAPLSSLRALAGRRASDPAAVLERGDLRTDHRVARAPRLIVICVDLSGSMGAPARATAATGA